MASKLKVAELRAELEERGLDATGLKRDLVARLEEAMEAERGKKRTLDDEDEEEEHSNKRPKLDIERMTVAQLRSALSDRGLSTVGKKQELADRLTASVDDEAGTAVDDKKPKSEKQEGSSKEHIVTATKKGRAVLDKELPPRYHSYHVLEIGDDVYDAMLNQTNIAWNNNKYFVIQALESDDKRHYCTFTRWGRVGHRGVSNPQDCSSAAEAIALFEKKFSEKTRNVWRNRRQFVPHSGKYTLLEMDYGDEEPEEPKDDKKKKGVASEASKDSPKESKLDKRLHRFISLICNLSMMKQQMVEIGYNAEKMPLGKLSKRTISKGYEILKRISAVIESGGNRQELQELTSEFYTVIPHDFGRRDIRGQVISTIEQLNKKAEMVQSLGEIEVATKLLVDSEKEEDPAYARYKTLRCNLDPVDNDTEEYKWISKYLKNTHGHTHGYYNLQLEQVFRVDKEGETSKFDKFVNTPNRMLLWHGSRLTNWTGILSQGLRIAPPEAPVTGYMFGKGVYFADMVSKSANYCCTSQSEPVGVLLLCEVALGGVNELVNSDYNADRLPSGKLSTKGVGQTFPDPKDTLVLPDGVAVPYGKPVTQQTSDRSLLYNEYIVYNTAQIRMRYVLQVRFQYKRS